jgi:hypothetical protein
VRRRSGVSRDRFDVDGCALFDYRCEPVPRATVRDDLGRRLLTVGAAKSHCDAFEVGGDE